MQAYKQRGGDIGTDDEDAPQTTGGAATDGSTQAHMASCESMAPSQQILLGVAAASGPSSVQVQTSAQGSASASGSEGSTQQRRRRPINRGSVEQKFTGSLADMTEQLGNREGLTAEETAAAVAEMSRRKRRASLTAGDDMWEDMIVKDRPRRETNTGLDRDHKPLAVIRGRGGSVAEHSLREGSRADRMTRREASIAERRTRRLTSVAEHSRRRGDSSADRGGGQGGASSGAPDSSIQPEASVMSAAGPSDASCSEPSLADPNACVDVTHSV